MSKQAEGVRVLALLRIANYCRWSCRGCSLRYRAPSARRFRFTRAEIVRMAGRARTSGLHSGILTVPYGDSWYGDQAEELCRTVEAETGLQLRLFDPLRAQPLQIIPPVCSAQKIPIMLELIWLVKQAYPRMPLALPFLPQGRSRAAAVRALRLGVDRVFVDCTPSPYRTLAQEVRGCWCAPPSAGGCLHCLERIAGESGRYLTYSETASAP